MKFTTIHKTYLSITGLLLLGIGGSTLLFPEMIKAASGIDLGNNINLLNETRASAALLLVAALLTLSGVVNRYLTQTATIIAPLSFLAIGLGRLLSILLDGMPVDSLVKATALEFILGILGIVLLSIHLKKQSHGHS